MAGKLDSIIESLRNMPKIRVGILGNAMRANSGVTNAQIGAAHEFGTEKIPARSFLRMPLTTRLPLKLKSAGIDAKRLIEHAENGDMSGFVNKIGIAAQATILEAFDTGGFGTWQALKPEIIARKTDNQTQILVETTQLRDSVSYEVSE